MIENRKQNFIKTLKSVLAELVGKDLSDVDPQATFFELGFDSLLLTQVAVLLKKRFQVKITFRQLLEELTSMEAIARYIDEKMPADHVKATPSNECEQSDSPEIHSLIQEDRIGICDSSQQMPTSSNHSASTVQPSNDLLGTRPGNGQNGNSATVSSTDSALERVMREQLKLMARQLEMLKGVAAHVPAATSTVPWKVAKAKSAAMPEEARKPGANEDPRRFGPFKPIEVGFKGGLTQRQEKAIADLTVRYNQKTAGSKAYAQRHRSHFCDPRAAGNFRQMWKEMVYPIVCARSKGSKIWDIDGNEYVDLTLGFGANYFGHAPEFVVRAVEEQLGKGFEIGPQSPLAGEAAQMLCEMTGMERATFCNTGSEAVMAAIRVARTVTGRDKIVYFTGDYHGIFDEVLARAGTIDGQPGAFPIAPGIPSLPYVMVLDYGNPSSLEVIHSHANEIAAVLVEPVQSRHPDYQPREFLQALRQTTIKHDIALIFDEVVTGMRAAPGGAQEYFGVRADLAAYGKVVGGGMPLGVLAGTRRFMDALDGGMWSFGDDSFPEVGVTFFAGTFVRHPLAMAATHATLQYLKQAGPELQRQTTEKTARFVNRLNNYFTSVEVPIRLQTFSSVFYYDFHSDLKFAGLLFYHLRDRGVHIWEGRVGQICTVHTEEELNFVFEAFKSSVEEMQAGGFLPATKDDKPLNEHVEVQRLKNVPLTTTASGTSQPLFEKGKDFNTPVISNIRTLAPPDNATASDDKKMDFSVYLFGSYAAEYHPDKYRLVIEAAKFADTNGFKAIWLPERHFHPIGGFSPNPSVIAAALARETRQLHLRAGSVVLPLHHPVRIAEEWAVVDNLSNGRTGISIASGWHPNDFVFAPDAFDRRRELCWDGYEVIQKLWRGEEVEFPTGGKNRLGVKLYPMPKQPRLPTWLTCIHKESYIKAGELGLGVLGYTMNTTLDELAEKIRLYREAFKKHGHDPRIANVTILMHTFIGPDQVAAQQTARKPMRDYLRTHLDNSQRRLENQHSEVEVAEEDIEYLLDRGFEDYLKGKALIGSPESCSIVVNQIKQMGVDEIGCFLDFGIDHATVLSHLPQIAKLQRLCGNDPFQSQHPINTGLKPTNGMESGRSVSLTDEQRGLVVVAAQSKNASRTYTEGNTLEFRGALDFQALRRALQKCVDWHEALRTSLNADGESQTIHSRVTLDVAFEDISALHLEPQNQRLKDIFGKIEAEAFDLCHAPVMWAHVIKLAENRHWLLLFFHHTLGNGPAYWILFDDLCAFYQAECTGVPNTRLKPLQLNDFVDWRAKRATSEEYKADEAFWMQQFVNPPPALDLPLDRPRPALKSYSGGREIVRLERDLIRAARQAGAAHQCSLFMVLLTAFESLLHRLSGQDDVVVGTPFESEARLLPGGEGMFANTTNMTLLRSRLLRSTTFTELLLATKNRILECQEHQDYFFGNLFRKLGVRSDSGRAGLFSVGFNFESGKFLKQVAGVEIEFLTDHVPYRCPKDTAMFDLNLNVAEQNGELLCECDYDADIFFPDSVRRMLNQFKIIIEAAATNSDQPVLQFDLLTKNERRQLLVEWNQTERSYDQSQTVHKLFQVQAQANPDKVAVRCGPQSITYNQLEDMSDRVATRLQELGVKHGDLIGLYAERSADMVVGLVGILKSGAAYVPMDPDFPRDRLRHMVEASQMRVIVTQMSLAGEVKLFGTEAVVLDEPAREVNIKFVPGTATADDIAYVIFTSGSTGRPKGVSVHHGAVVNFLSSMRRAPGLASDDVLLAVTTLSFDIAALEIFLPLTVGATVVIAKRDSIIDGHLLRADLEQSGATVMQATPITWRLLLESGWTGGSRLKILCGGEALPADLAAQLLPCCAQLWNMYGPTETTIWSTCWLVTKADRPIRIGRPIDNTQIYIVDEAMQLQPIGVVGELLIGGDGVAVGYHQFPELTAEKFITDHFSNRPGARLYRTGDLARWHTDGTIECLGRHDQQIKMRGFRIELGEVESVVSDHPSVRECLAVVREDSAGQKRLVCYVTKKDGDKDLPMAVIQSSNGSASLPNALKALAQLKLPGYMVPSIVIVLEKMPRTPNGKVDRKALLALPIDIKGEDYEFVAPRNEKEETLANIWKQVLGLEKVSVRENFFELGGDSLLSFRVVNRATQVGLPLTPRMFFQHNTIADLVKAVNEADEGDAKPSTPAIVRVARDTYRHKLPVTN